MPEKNINNFEEFVRRCYQRTTKHLIEDNMDLDESLSSALEETSGEVILDAQKEFMAQVLKMIFRK